MGELDQSAIPGAIRLTRWGYLSVMVGVAGIFWLFSDSIGDFGNKAYIYGALLTLLATLAWIAGSYILRRGVIIIIHLSIPAYRWPPVELVFCNIVCFGRKSSFVNGFARMGGSHLPHPDWLFGSYGGLFLCIEASTHADCIGLRLR